MGKMEEDLSRLRRFNASIRGDSDTKAPAPNRLDIEERAASPALVERLIERESIVLRAERPVLAIRDNQPILEFRDEGDKVWATVLQQARPFLENASRAVGRIELTGARLDWVGTGWLVNENIMVTNRHVASEFARRRGDDFAFRTGIDGPIRADIDFVQEIENEASLRFALVRPLHIEEDPGPDVAFFEVEIKSGERKLAMPIDLSASPTATARAATIGYPAFDSRVPDRDLMEKIFGSTYDKKRLAPGAVTRVDQTNLLHNCTTLGGNSGSVVLDLDSGKALGLHFSGSFLKTNYAVRADVVQKIFSNLRSAGGRAHLASKIRPSEAKNRGGIIWDVGRNASVAGLTIPLRITVSLGSAGPLAHFRRPLPVTDSGMVEGEEGIASDYDDRRGYQPDFLGENFPVDLPRVVRDADDVLGFARDGGGEEELRYEHFSVVMSRSRRMCFYSAVNVDGKRSRKNTRAGWKWDPRLLRSQQIMNECYGNPPKFSRGHMTRREDPGWGTPAEARRGNEDSMHVTNTVPQMQKFNSPIWLALEDYALSHAREDGMKISVFTGPYFRDDDPEMYEVRIPVAFWKIIAFVHDETGELCATGYEMNQGRSLPPEREFVYGAFTSPRLAVATQVSIRSIEMQSGINFGELAGVDPLEADAEGFGETVELDTLEQIRFAR
jgi:endonuclease G, mitochondrial